MLTELNQIVHHRELPPAGRLLLCELLHGGSATMDELLTRTGWSRPTVRSHVNRLIRHRFCVCEPYQSAHRYSAAQPRFMARTRLDHRRVSVLLRILRDGRTPQQRLVLLHLALTAGRYIPIQDRVADLDISLDGFETARAELARVGLVQHRRHYNASIPKDVFCILRVPQPPVPHPFREAADILAEANNRNQPPAWWAQAFRDEHVGKCTPKELVGMVKELHRRHGQPKCPRVYNPTQLWKHVRWMRRRWLKKKIAPRSRPNHRRGWPAALVADD